MREWLEEIKAFEKETTFLVNYVEAAKEMCKQKGREGFLDFYPKCYYGDEDMIVLENVVLDKGYEVLSTEIQQDLEAARFAIRTLAKHHAISYVMIKDAGGADKFFERFPTLDFPPWDKPCVVEMLEPTFDKSINSLVKMLKTSGLEQTSHIVSKLNNCLGKAMKAVQDAFDDYDDDTLMVLGHGDYWNNNMMFRKDKETQKIKHHIAIDFQITHYNSPAIDLGFYLYSSVQWRVRQGHLRELLELYTETFNNVTKDFGHPTSLTYEQLFLEFRKKLDFGFWLGFTMAVGPGMAVFKGVDVTDMDPKDLAEVSDKLLNKWIDENPDKAVQVAEHLVKLMEEYEELLLK